MSAKKAKQLRKLIKAVIQDRTASGEFVNPVGLYVERERNRKYAMISKELGAEPENTLIAAGTVMTSPGSARGINRAIKKQHKLTPLIK